MTFRALLAGCWFAHEEPIRERVGDDRVYSLCCPRCGHTQPILSSPVVPGPAHQKQEDLGQVKTKAMRVATNARGGRYDLGPSQPVSFARRK